MNYCAWRYGRNFGMWHRVQGGPRSTLMRCGARVPDKALVNYATVVPEEEVCEVCRERDEPRLTAA